jgi:putative peptidoglycan lipid II flippase
MRRPYLFMTAGGVCSKVLAAAREILMAHAFGTGAVTDAYRASLTATLSPVHLLTTQVIQTCFIPLCARDLAHAPRRAHALFQALTLTFFALAVLLAVALFLFAHQFVALLLPGFDPGRQAITVRMLRVMALGIPAYVFTSQLGALGAAHQDFLIPGVRPAAQNFGMLAAILLAVLFRQPVWAAYGFTGTYVAMSLWAAGVLWRRGYIAHGWLLERAMIGGLAGSLWVILRPLLLVTLLGEASLLIERTLGSLVGGGTIAAMDYARFLTETAHSLLILPLGLISLSAFATLEPAVLAARVDRLCGLILIFFLPLSAFFLMNGREILALAYLRGSFDNASLAASTRALLGLGAGLWAYSASHFLRRVLNARMENRVVLRGELLGVAIGIVTSLAGYRTWGILALGLAPSLSAIVSFAVYARHLRLGRGGAARAGALILLALPAYLLAAYFLRQGVTGLGGLVLQCLLALLYWGVFVLLVPAARALVRERGPGWNAWNGDSESA